MNKRQRNLLISVLGIVLCCFAALYGIDRSGVKVLAEQEKVAQAQTRKENNQAETMAEYKKMQEQLFKKIQAAIDKRKDLKAESIAISFYDIDSGTKLNLNGSTVFAAGSTTKVAVALDVADKIKAGEMSGSDMVYYHQSDYEEGTGYLISHLDEAKAITVDKLLEYMLVYSDNIATNMFYRILGDYDGTREYIKEHYLSDFDTSDNNLTPDEGIQLLTILYENKGKNEYYDKIIDYLKNTDFPERLETTKTADVLAHKIGSVDNSIHDMGIFYTEHPYMLAMFTTGLDDAPGDISSLSNEIYDLMTKEYPMKPEK